MGEGQNVYIIEPDGEEIRTWVGVPRASPQERRRVTYSGLPAGTLSVAPGLRVHTEIRVRKLRTAIGGGVSADRVSRQNGQAASGFSVDIRTIDGVGSAHLLHTFLQTKRSFVNIPMLGSGLFINVTSKPIRLN